MSLEQPNLVEREPTRPTPEGAFGRPVVAEPLALDLFHPAALDLTRATWRTSSYSGGNGSCVEVADLGTRIAVRDSKDRSGPALVFSREAWREFVAKLRSDDQI